LKTEKNAELNKLQTVHEQAISGALSSQVSCRQQVAAVSRFRREKKTWEASQLAFVVEIGALDVVDQPRQLYTTNTTFTKRF